jgi:hypothetical protein
MSHNKYLNNCLNCFEEPATFEGFCSAWCANRYEIERLKAMGLVAISLQPSAEESIARSQVAESQFADEPTIPDRPIGFMPGIGGDSC